MTNLLEMETYNPAALFDALMDRLHVRNDSALAKKIGVTPPVISKMRNKKVQITATLLVQLHDITGESLDALRTMAGIPKSNLATGKSISVAEQMTE